ncbi:MAG: hypothetical protein NDI61_11120 [Bdellovibrionaceae bacterium]|nr:hypothetical protein [Pseudobdellovibrionaceae bacterium]
MTRAKTEVRILSWLLLSSLIAGPAFAANLALRGEILTSSAPRIVATTLDTASFELGGSGETYLLALESVSLKPGTDAASQRAIASIPSSTQTRNQGSLQSPAQRSTLPIIVRSGARVPLALETFQSGSVVRIILTAP